jgi:Fic family protein
LKKDSNLAKNIPEEYGKYRKTHVGIVGSEFETAESHKIYLLLDELIKDFNYRRNIKLSDICEFHVRFESIHPYRDGNGRIGRMIMFKQCLENNIIPFVITKHSRNQYIDCLKIFNKQGEIKYLEKFIIKLQKDFREKYLNDDGKNMGKNEILIIKFLAKNNYASRKELEKYINLKERAMKILIKSMVIKKIISPVGKGKNTIYKLYS